MFNKISWLLKYYFFAFLFIFGIAYYLNTLEPSVNWSFYTNNLKKEISSAVNKKDCKELKKYYYEELETNFESGLLGNVRKDKKLIRGLNLLSYLEFHIKKSNCN